MENQRVSHAYLVNRILDDVIARINKKSKPVIHPDTINGRNGLREWKQMDTLVTCLRKGCSSDNVACEGSFGQKNGILL